MNTLQSKKIIPFIFCTCLLFIWIHFTFIKVNHAINSDHFYIYKIFIHVLLAIFLIFNCNKLKTKKAILFFSFLVPIILSAVVYFIVAITVRLPKPNMLFEHIAISLFYPYLAIGGWLGTIEILIVCMFYTKYLK